MPISSDQKRLNKEATHRMFATLEGGKSSTFLAGIESRNKTTEALEVCQKELQHKSCKLTAFVQI